MLVKNSLAVAWILQNPMAGRKIKEPLETELSGDPWGVGWGGSRWGALQCFQTHFYVWIFKQQTAIIFMSLFCKMEVHPLHPPA